MQEIVPNYLTRVTTKEIVDNSKQHCTFSFFIGKTTVDFFFFFFFDNSKQHWTETPEVTNRPQGLVEQQ